MPTDNKQPQTTSSLPPVPTDDMSPLIVEDTTPPMLNDNDLPVVNTPPAVTTEEKPSETDSGSAAPSNDVVMAPIVTTQKKKFAGGKVIATILGLFLLVGGVGAGIVLVNQNQNIQEKAASNSCTLCLNNVDNPDECYPSPCGGGNDGGIIKPPSHCECGVKPGGGCKACDDGEVVHCTPDCSGKNCGNDGCGGSCGTCSGTSICGGGGPGVCGAPSGGCTSTNAILGYCSPPPGFTGDGCISAGCGTGQYCHCQGGQSCDYGICVNQTDFVTACTGDGRQPSHNSDNETAWTCCAAGYVAAPGLDGCVPATGGGGGTPPGATTPPTITASCQNLKAYRTTGELKTPMTQTELAALRSGDIINLCVKGIKSGGSFDKVRFTINGVLQAEQPMNDRIGSTVEGEFCSPYTIPQTLPANKTFTFTAEMHHVTLGWK